MASFKAVITDAVGLHARPASIVVNEAAKYESNISISSNGKTGNLKSIMNVIALGVKNGDEITIEASGSDADTAVANIKAALEKTNLI